MACQPVDLLVFSPHPDDAEFGMAGTVARFCREGKKVVYVIITGGEKGTDDADMAPGEMKKIRQAEQKAAAQVLGVEMVVFLDFIDGCLEDDYGLRLAITRQIRRFQPSAVATTDPYRRYLLHRDHRIAGLAVAEAVYPFARNRPAFPELIDEKLEPHTVREMLFWGSENPNHFVDITDTFNLKMNALKCHASQVAPHGENDLELWLRKRAQDAAERQGFELAETFYRFIIEH